MDTNTTFGAPWQPLTGLIDPFVSGSDIDEPIKPTSPYVITPDMSVKQEKEEEDTEESQSQSPLQLLQPFQYNTRIEQMFLYLAIMLCIGLLIAILYWVFNKHLFYSLIIVLITVILHILLNFAQLENSKNIMSIGSILLLVTGIILLIIIVRNKRKFT